MKFRYDKTSEELVVTSATRIEYHQLQLSLTRKIKGYRFHRLVKLGIWDGSISFFDNGRVNLGLWRECLKACRTIDASFILENKEDFPLNKNITIEKLKEFCSEFFKNHKIKNKETGNWDQFIPYDHQIESAFRILKNRFALCEVATSGGKSLIVSIVFFYTLRNMDPNAKFLIIVPNLNLVTQFYDAIMDFNIGENKEFDGGNPSPLNIKMEEIMSEVPRKHGNDPNIYIGTFQSLEKRPEEFFKQFHTVACDEAHMAKAKTIVKVLKNTFNSAYSRFGVSGTFPPEDSAEILTIQSVLGPIITEISATELKEKGVITPMEIKAVFLNHKDSEFQNILKAAKKGIDSGKQVLELEKKYIHNSKKRLEMIGKLVDKCQKNTLILFHTIKYGEKIFNELNLNLKDKQIFYIDGGVKNKDREDIKINLEKTDGKVKVLVASYGTLSTGVSIKNLHYLILVDSFKSEQVVIQSMGRILRVLKDKDKAIIFDLVDTFESENPKNILYKHFLERQKFYDKREYPWKIMKINL